MSEALPGASGTAPASRAATITICRRELPGAAADHVHEAAAILREALHHRAGAAPARETARREGAGHELRGRAIARRAGAPVRLLGRDTGRQLGRLLPSKRTSAARPCGSPRGRLSNENMVRTTARSAGTNAARYIRGSINGAATYNSRG